MPSCCSPLAQATGALRPWERGVSSGVSSGVAFAKLTALPHRLTGDHVKLEGMSPILPRSESV